MLFDAPTLRSADELAGAAADLASDAPAGAADGTAAGSASGTALGPAFEPTAAADLVGDLIFDLDTPELLAHPAPAEAPFHGALAATRRRSVRVRSANALVSVEVYVAINADTDPELGRLARGERATGLHALMVAGEPLELAVPFIYHEPCRRLFALVVPPALRHRELDERIELYRQLQLEPADAPIPRYVLEAEVVIGAAGLRALRDRPAAATRNSPVVASAAPSGPSGPPAHVAPPRSSPFATPDVIDADATAATRTAPDAEIPELSDVPAIRLPSAPSDGVATSTDASISGAISGGFFSVSSAGVSGASGVPRATLGNSLPGIPIAALAPRPAASAASDAALGARAAELEAWQRALEQRAAELEQRTGALVRREGALQDRQRRLEAKARATSEPVAAEPSAALAAASTASGPLTAPSEALPAIEPIAHFPIVETLTAFVPPPPRPPGAPAASASAAFAAAGATGKGGTPRLERAGDSGATPDTIDEDLSADMSRATRQLPPGADPITTEVRDQPVYEPDEWLAHVIAAGASDLTVEHGRARVALAATSIGDADVLRGALDVRVVLHRADAYPVVVLLIGSPAGLRGDRRDQIAAMCLDVSAERDRAVLAQLAKSFEIVLEVFASGRWIRRVLVSAPLADNVAYVLRAADDYLHSLAEAGAQLSASRAMQQVAHPGYDVTGIHHPEAEHFCDRSLVAVRTAVQLRAALDIAERFATPEGEDYLLCVRGFPLVRWRRLRRHVLEQAVTWGIWMGAELARVAVSEGLARSRRDLAHRLHEGFAILQQHPSACDLDPGALAENAAALAREAQSLGVVPGKARTLIDSEMESVVAGTIDLVPSRPRVPVAAQSIDELVAALEQPEARLPAALELCRRGAERALPAVVAALGRMSRVEAVQVLAASVRLGLSIEAPLIAALGSSKSYVRQGAALALGLLRSDDGVAAIVHLLLTEPTEIWREVARALGQVGPQALHHLARTAREQGASALLEERAAWALAHLAARDCHKAIAQMASGHGLLAPIAAKGLALEETAQRDQQALVSDEDFPEPTVNRTFSRQFFAAVAGELAGDLEEGQLDDGDMHGELDDDFRDHGSQVIAISDAQGQRRSASEDDL